MSIQDLSKGYVPIALVISLGIALVLAGMQGGMFIESTREDHNALLTLQVQVADMQGKVVEIRKLLELRPPCISGAR